MAGLGTGLIWTEVWTKKLHDSSFAAVLFNRGDWSGAGPGAPVTLKFAEIKEWASVSNKRFAVRDLWNRTDLGTFAEELTLVAPDHGVRFVKITPLP